MVVPITTRKPATAIVRTMCEAVGIMDSAPSETSSLAAIKKDKDWKRIKKQMDELQNSSLYLDDGDAVPSADFLEKWAAEKGITVVVRRD